MMKCKRGAELALNQLILYALGLGILLILIYIVYITQKGSENIFVDFMKRLRFG